MLEFITKMNPEIPCDYVWDGNDELECGHSVLEDTPSRYKRCTGHLLERPGFCPLKETAKQGLNVFIHGHNLGTDQHHFAKIPKKDMHVMSAFKDRLSASYQEAVKFRLHKQMQPIYDMLVATAKDGRDFADINVNVEVAKIVAEREGLAYDISDDEHGGPVIKIWGWS